jgi:hypothetical protein
MYPWLGRVEVDALDPLGSGKELPLRFCTRSQPILYSIAPVDMDKGLCCADLESYLDVQTHLRDSHSTQRYNE